VAGGVLRSTALLGDELVSAEAEEDDHEDAEAIAEIVCRGEFTRADEHGGDQHDQANFSAGCC
jgi:hypothetical protein